MPLKRLSWFAAATALAITALFGGLQRADHVTAVSFGQTYDNGPLRITPHSVTVTDQMRGFPDLPAQCRYVVMKATIVNDADREVSFGIAMAMLPTKPCSMPHQNQDSDAFQIDGITANYVGAVRLRDGFVIPEAVPGFTEDYALVWWVPTKALKDTSGFTIRMHQMSRFISTFRIDSDWAGDASRYGALRVTNLEVT